MTRRNPLLTLTAVSAAALSLALAACGKNDDNRTVGQAVDQTIASTEQKAGELKEDIKSGAEAMGDKAREAADATSNAVGDAAITTAVNAELARDPSLSALRIDVDTQNGHVQLKGTAPDAEAKARATTLAAGVKGVVNVDNQLDVAPKS